MPLDLRCPLHAPHPPPRIPLQQSRNQIPCRHHLTSLVRRPTVGKSHLPRENVLQSSFFAPSLERRPAID
ncbi:hypothetical protein IEQ34_006348 [Dendrobium chrysotoxum]|uniref:Uncharacterized protein n=1 Tax=Dendrobium chrysotoxum TaxID=161865 RepID=A0AAV7GWJ4_DENCH|nr:hypothetical protein IEQ34_006348 [Dendrobium chrysotoxum]